MPVRGFENIAFQVKQNSVVQNFLRVLTVKMVPGVTKFLVHSFAHRWEALLGLNRNFAIS